jgi:hypothetical protein
VYKSNAAGRCQKLALAVIDLARGGAGDVEEVKYEEVKCAVGGPDATPPPNPGSECSSGDDSRYAFSSGGDFDPLDPGTEVEFARSDSRTDVENEGFDSGFLDFLDGVDVSGGYPNLDEVVGDMPDAVSGDFKGWEVDLVDSASHYRETMVGWPGGGSELSGGGSESSTGRKEKFIAQEDKCNQEVDTLLPDSQLATAISRTVHSTDSQRSSTLDEDRLLEPSIIEAADQQQGCTKVVVENRSAEAACAELSIEHLAKRRKRRKCARIVAIAEIIPERKFGGAWPSFGSAHRLLQFRLALFQLRLFQFRLLRLNPAIEILKARGESREIGRARRTATATADTDKDSILVLL